MSQLLATYIRDIIPFRQMINSETPRNGFLFGDAKGPWSTDIQTKAFIRESTSSDLNFRVTTQDYRHMSIAIDRKFIRGEDAEIYEDEEDDVNDLMSAHSTRTANARYGRDSALLHMLTAHSIDLFRSISDRWQKWLGLVPRGPREEEKNEEMKEEVPLETQLLRGLTKIYGGPREYKSEQQKKGVMAMAKGVSPLIVVMPTGGGKTLLIQLPAMLKGAKTTIVVTPLKALANDLWKRCDDADIDCIKWTRWNQRRAKIVIIVTETATTVEFGKYVLDLHLAGHLDRMIFDEAHKLLTDRSYRPKFEEVKRLAIPCQLGFLTATLPPHLMTDLEKLIVLPDPIYIRAPTNRINIRYSVVRHNGDIYEGMVRRVQNAKDRLPLDAKILVFCNSKRKCDRLAEMLSCGVYYSDARRKDEVLEEWQEGNNQVLIATGALGAGVDISRILEVIHMGEPFSLIDFIQESSRAGRQGEIVQSTVVLDEEEYQAILSRDPRYLTQNEAALREFLVTKGCVRMPISKYMDGPENEIDCEKLNGERCEGCQVRYKETEAGKRRRENEEAQMEQRKRAKIYQKRVEMVNQDQQNESMRMARLEQVWERLEKGCPACWVLNGWESADHRFDDCSVLNEMLGESYWRVKRRVSYGRDSCCFSCSRPCDWCDDYCNGRRCVRQDSIVAAGLTAFLARDRDLNKVITDTAGKRFSDLKWFIKWLSGKVRIMNGNGTNALAVFDALVEFRDRN